VVFRSIDNFNYPNIQLNLDRNWNKYRLRSPMSLYKVYNKALYFNLALQKISFIQKPYISMPYIIRKMRRFQTHIHHFGFSLQLPKRFIKPYMRRLLRVLLRKKNLYKFRRDRRLHLNLYNRRAQKKLKSFTSNKMKRFYKKSKESKYSDFINKITKLLQIRTSLQQMDLSLKQTLTTLFTSLKFKIKQQQKNVKFHKLVALEAITKLKRIDKFINKFPRAKRVNKSYKKLRKAREKGNQLISEIMVQLEKPQVKIKAHVSVILKFLVKNEERLRRFFTLKDILDKALKKKKWVLHALNERKRLMKKKSEKVVVTKKPSFRVA